MSKVLPKVLIIGAGVNGLMLAMECLNQGFAVEVIDKDPIDQIQGPSSLQYQIIRPQYTNEFGWSSRVRAAMEAWQDVFSSLRKNYMTITGVVAVSFEKGDWADRVTQSMSNQQLPLRHISHDRLRNMMPAFKLDEAIGGVLADFGGVIQATGMMTHLRQYLREKGVVFYDNCEAISVQGGQVKIKGKAQTHSADWVIVTSGHKQLMPDHFESVSTYTSYFADIDIQTGAQRAFWHYMPNWVDMGGSGNLWGIPRIGSGQGTIRIGAGSLTHISDQEPDLAQIKNQLNEYYRNLIHDFDDYAFSKLHKQNYAGFEDGRMKLVRDGQTLGILADSGHGFKFAAQNAKYVSEAFEHENFGMAARRVAGAL